MAMVEMALVLPVLLLVMFGIAECGVLLNRWLTLTNAVREGARAGVVWDDTCDDDPVAAEDRIKDRILDYAAAGKLDGVFFEAGDITGVCGGSGSDLAVTARYDFSVRFPYTDFGTLNLKYTSTMRNE